MSSKPPGMTDDQMTGYCLCVGYSLAVLVGIGGIVEGAITGYGPAIGGGICSLLLGGICLLATIAIMRS